MTRTIEIVRFTAHDEAALIASRDALVALLRERFADDFVSAQLGKFEDGSYLESITWASSEAAARAAQEIPTLPAAQAFFSQISDVREMHHVAELHSA